MSAFGFRDALQPPRGFDDLLPEQMAIKRRIEEEIRRCFVKFGYQEIETPTLEYYDLFEAKSGEEIRERMFVFLDKHERKVVLRPEMTAPVARLVATSFKNHPLPLRLGYLSDCYRYDEPQWGRKRRFWQGGLELFGVRGPAADVEILEAAQTVFEGLNIRDFYFKLGHVGVLRALMRDAGVEEETQDLSLSYIDRNKFDETFSLLRSKDAGEEVIESLRTLVKTQGHDVSKILDEGRNLLSPWPGAVRELNNLEEIVTLSRETGIRAKIVLHLGFARGLEYYTGFIFEQYVPQAEIALNSGGRYDKLVSLFGGPEIHGVGCAIGVTRIQEVVAKKEFGPVVEQAKPWAGLINIGQKSLPYALSTASKLRERGLSVESDLTGRKLQAAIEHFAKKGVGFLIIVGDKEMAEGKVTVRDLSRHSQQEFLSSEPDKIVVHIETHEKQKT